MSNAVGVFAVLVEKLAMTELTLGLKAQIRRDAESAKDQHIAPDISAHEVLSLLNEVENLEIKLNKCFGSGPSAYMELGAKITKLEAALKESLEGWSYAASYKMDYLREKHGDDEDIERLRRLL